MTLSLVVSCVPGVLDAGGSELSAAQSGRTDRAVTQISMRIVFFMFLFCCVFYRVVQSGLTKKAEPPPTRDVNRDSGTASANGGWLRRLVRRRLVKCGH